MSNESLQISPVIKGYLLSRGYTENFTVSPIAGAGSGRQYFRISEEKLSMVDQAEQLLLDLGFHQLRVRIHDKMARIEILPEEFEKLLAHRQEINSAFKNYGFTYVTMDLQGYRTGSMNETLPMS
jgi:PP-loop superfamily ATP-utilizing enzyme